ncbi:putative reverse transcriptase zinc-binding domain-containing protein [Helianthus annuus]|nr:putative reverse transcriptase zinc-binding domain-containing protein [Helianthus annuus]KAJ0859519.1 putative reverse transcriptase zinc-binding domain-containing protein [Helianthus annuus]
MNWVAWDWITWPKSKGGLGINRLKEINLALLFKWGWMYRVENQNLWRKVVEACHGNNNQRSFLPLNVKTSGCWKNIVNAISNLKINGKGLNSLILGKVGNGEEIRFWLDTWLGDKPFVERWPHLFGLELSKMCRVADKRDGIQGYSGFVWNWYRQPETDAELREWQECQEVLSRASFSNNEDLWLWNDENQEGFSVKAVKMALIKDRGVSHPPNFEWCKWVPIKCNIMAWRGNLDRLATRVNLRRRNVNISSVMCPFCDEFEETVEHLFTACSVVERVWSAFSAWCKLPQIYAFDFKDIMEIHNFTCLSKKAKSIIQGLVMISCWCIWKGRNDLVFKQFRRSPQDILGEVKSKGYGWARNRTPCNYISWVDWCKYPLYML